jgi:hypothetical protein
VTFLEESGDTTGKALELMCTLPAVRDVGLIRKEDETLVREPPVQVLEHAQASHAGIENADGVTCGWLTGLLDGTAHRLL